MELHPDFTDLLAALADSNIESLRPKTMRIIKFDQTHARDVSDERLRSVSVAPLTAPMATDGTAQAAVFRIGPGGCIARHPATVPQVLAVIEGAGEVSGGDARFVSIRAGEAAVWDAGEEHETRSDRGLTAVVIEGTAIVPSGS